MVDLEAFGAVTVTGDMGFAEALVRSLALELATGEVLSNAYLLLVGFDLIGVDHLPRVMRRTGRRGNSLPRGHGSCERQGAVRRRTADHVPPSGCGA